MRRGLQLALLVVLAAVCCWAGDRIDGIAATVNGSPILQSDWDEEVRYEALLNVRPPAQVTEADRQSALQRLIDQELLRQQMGRSFPLPAPEEISQRLQQLRSQYPGGDTDAAWRQILVRYGLLEEDIAERLAAQLQIMRFVEIRLRRDVQVDAASVEAYYRDTLLPQLRQAGAPELPLAQVADRIREILTQQRVDELLTSYLQDLRKQSRIRTEPESLLDRPATRPPQSKKGEWAPVGRNGGK